VSPGGGRRRYDDEGHSGILMLGGVTLLDVSTEGGYHPPADVNETPDGVSIRMEMPGVSVRNVQVVVRGARVEVSGEKRPDQVGCEASFICMERTFGKFCRVFEISGSVDLSRITAGLKGGVLTIFVPKVTERRGREQRVRIDAEDDTQGGR
jgi:HSP20 family protein